ncbi:hypothetical protein ACFYUV_20805 [Nonomuraea sp. NPDC003560]|uniref:hypothetical protein n=1 Tax=Nonomuraea sp. NPDC003560 TaxID=3364341 RepID=UPI0036ADED2F
MSEITPEKVAATPPTPENVAAMLTSGDNDYHDGNYWHPSIGSIGNVVHIGITPYADDDEGTKLPEVHFRAVVVEGETDPIVLPRPDTSFLGLDFEGGAFGDDDAEGWQVVPYSTQRRWTCSVQEANCVEFRGAPGRISFAEARRFAAALVAVADAAEAAQAEKGGTDA